MSPELSLLKDTGRAEFHSATDKEALDGMCALDEDPHRFEIEILTNCNDRFKYGALNLLKAEYFFYSIYR